MKISAYIAVSLDGFIARDDHSIDWLPKPDLNSNEDYGFDDFFSSVDALVMGRNTYEIVVNSGYQWPYKEKKVFVLTNRNIEIADNIKEYVFSISGTPNEIINNLQQNNIQHIYIDGGKVIQSFLKLNLINEITITQIPILLGSGIPLFSKLNNDIYLSVISSKLYKNDLIKNHYQINYSNK
ncbi:MAG: dihydrofolate reductase family protein [Anaplasmataceae bacterium]|nr:dihydrofolate reductase family protein [Anaplasmataceae bacterium]